MKNNFLKHNKIESAPDLAEKKINSEIIFEGEFLNLRKDKVIAADGHLGVREYFSHPGAVAILPFLTNEKLLLETEIEYFEDVLTMGSTYVTNETIRVR